MLGLLREVIVAMVDLAVGSNIGVATVGVLDIPMKFFVSTGGTRMRYPLIILGIEIAVLLTTRRRFQPIATFGRQVRMPPGLG